MPARPRLLGLLAVAIVLTACPSQAPTPSPARPHADAFALAVDLPVARFR